MRLIESAYQYCSHPDNIEVIIRFDSDDGESIPRIRELARFGPQCRHLVGDRLKGYASVATFCQELDAVASCDWRWHLNDDMVIQRRDDTCKYVPFDKQVESHPTTGVLLQPEWHQLGGSGYQFDAGGSAPIYPKSLIEGIGMQNPPDKFLMSRAQELEWETKFLMGVGFWHDWQGQNIPQ